MAALVHRLEKDPRTIVKAIRLAAVGLQKPLEPAILDQADAVGDKKTAALFRQIAADEGDHYASYKAAVEKLRAGK